MSESEPLPDEIDSKFVLQTTPTSAQAVIVAQHLNRVIRYLKSIQNKLNALPDFTKPPEGAS